MHLIYLMVNYITENIGYTFIFFIKLDQGYKLPKRKVW